MGVYLWTDSLEINSDLVNSSLEKAKSEGWDNIVSNSSGTYTIGSSGISFGGSSAYNNTQVTLYKEIPQFDEHIVELNIKGTATRAYSNHSWQYNCWCFCGLTSSNALDMGGAAFAGGYNTGSNAHGYIGINKNGGLLGNTSTTFTGGNIDITTKFNLKTGLVEYTCSAPISFTSSYTLSSSDLALIKTYKYVAIGGLMFEGSVNYITISNASIKVTPA